MHYQITSTWWHGCCSYKSTLVHMYFYDLMPDDTNQWLAWTKGSMELNCLTFMEIVKNAPLVAIDLNIRNSQHEVLLGLRNNEPARNFWFVPGGRIFKSERISNEFQRIIQDELGIYGSIQHAKFVGVYEHLYQENFARQAGFGTHYIVLAYEIHLHDENHCQLSIIFIGAYLLCMHQH